MLTSINLQPLEFTALNTDLSPAAAVSADSAEPITGFAELLDQPLPTAESETSAATGQVLPDGGNVLPAQELEALPDSGLIALQSGPGEADNVSTATVAGQDAPVLGGNVAADLLLPAGVSPNVAAQAETSTIAAEYRQSINPQAGSVVLATDLNALQAKTAAADPLQPEGRSGTSAIEQNWREAPTGNAIDRIQNLVRANTSSDAASGREFRVPVAAPPDDALSGMLERPQGLASLSASSVPPASGIASALQAIQGPLPATASNITPMPTPIDIPLQNAAWGDALSDRVLFMTGQKIHSAEIRLNPAEMGPITIRVAVENGAADIIFTAHHAGARDAIELAMPRLRELLSENGLLLANSSVTEGGVEQDAGGRETQEAAAGNTLAGDFLADDDVVQVMPVRVSQGLVDTFV